MCGEPYRKHALPLATGTRDGSPPTQDSSGAGLLFVGKLMVYRADSIQKPTTLQLSSGVMHLKSSNCLRFLFFLVSVRTSCVLCCGSLFCW